MDRWRPGRSEKKVRRRMPTVLWKELWQSSSSMWHYQEERVGCQRYCFWDIGKSSVQIHFFYIVFSTDHNSVTGCSILMWFASKYRIFLYVARSWCKDLKIENIRHATHFPWSCPIYCWQTNICVTLGQILYMWNTSDASFARFMSRDQANQVGCKITFLNLLND